MIDRIFTAVLAFSLLIGATLAIASAWFDSRSTVHTVRLPSVEVNAVRPARATVQQARLATVQVTAQRAAAQSLARVDSAPVEEGGAGRSQ
jgi:hypothetical protein